MKNNLNINSSCYRGCYPIGPTGPRGEIGPMGPTGPMGMPSARVSVGETITGAPSEDAKVYATGDDNNVILNFILPRGEVGPVPSLAVGNVVTGDEGSMAQVTITPIYESK